MKTTNYPSDLTDEQFARLEPLLPPAKPGGRPRTVKLHDIVDGILYVNRTGCQWRALPKDLPPRSTAHDYLTLWAWDGTLTRLHHALFVEARERAGKEASPSVAIIDSQSVRSAEKGGRASIRRATTPARKSPAASATSWWTAWGCCWWSWSRGPV